ncbi:MAG: methionine--tRNA ligase [Saprospiraceae bacterium]
MSDPKRYLVTSALPYANGELHLGHLAGAYLPADIYVRYLRLQGKDVAYICGSDENGAAITLRAKKEGITPQEIVDKYHNLFKTTFEKLGISFDYYHRTSSTLHHETAQEFFKKLLEKGDEFEEKVSEQYYDEGFDQFLADRYIIGTCPNCSYDKAYGDQCENCGKDLSPTELINPKSTLSGNKPVLRETKHWFFKLDKHEAWLKEWVEEGTLDGEPHHNAKAWRNHVVGQCKSWLDGGLLPRSITRDLDWGIPVPVEGAEGKVLYVWFDAPIGYISSTKQWASENGKNWEDFWKSDDAELVHFIGKDNIVFHCIVFPAMLKAHGDYNLPVNVPANQFLNFEGDKFSKSRGWGIEQDEYLRVFENFENKEDALRYALIRNMPENKDADFKWDDFVDFHDNELVANVGNFINRVVVLTNKYFEGKVPSVDVDLKEILAEVENLTQRLCQEIESFQFKPAISTLMEISSWGNTYLQDASPWTIYKTEPESEKIKEAMLVSLQIVALLGVLTKPFLPFSSDKIQALLNLPEVQNGDLIEILERLQKGQAILEAGSQIGEPTLLFAKINDRKDSSRLDIVNAQKEKLAAALEAKKASERAPVKDEITFEDFTKLDIRTGTIIEAEKVKKADKLLKIRVDLGFEERTIVSGIAKFFKPEDIIGQQVLLLANLAPRKMRGVESQGMILMAENEKGELTFVSADKKGEAEWGNGFGVS